MKNLKNSVRSIVSRALEGYKADTKKLKELEAMRERYSPEYYAQLRGGHRAERGHQQRTHPAA